MQKVVGINLNGNAYQLEEPGYEVLRAYLERAGSRLQANPDRAEIMADLEQAIAEKCGRYLGPNKTVVTVAEIETLIEEMGPVETPEATAEGAASAAPDAEQPGAQPGPHTNAQQGAPRRLYQIREGALLTGVCTGIAAFFNIDVTIVRVIFVLLTVVTFGAWILAYILMAIIIPCADTPEDRAAAYGLRLKAQEFLNEAHLRHASARARNEWRRSWRRQQRAWRRNWNEHWHHNWDRHWQQQSDHVRAGVTGSMPPIGPLGHTLAGISLPLFAVVNAALFVAWVLVMLSAVITGTLFGWPLPADLPLWGVLLILFAVYLVLAMPLRAARYGAHHVWGAYYGPWAALSGLFWIGSTVVFFWLAYRHIPEVHALFDQIPAFWQKRQISFLV
jgi:phage shock protein PspC (stress-responsive transcriptional regulator)